MYYNYLLIDILSWDFIYQCINLFLYNQHPICKVKGVTAWYELVHICEKYL